jgi:hypothetical protein
MGEHRALILDHEYEGEVESGEWLEVILPSGDSTMVQVVSLAWGSAFRADSPPLTIVVQGLGEAAADGAEVRGAELPG